LERDYPGTGPFECPTPLVPVAPTDDQRVRASQLTSDALEASILGDLENARALLEQASLADPTSPEVAYRHARALEDMQLRDAAILEYCRAMALGAADAGIADSRDRLDALYEVVRERITDRARNAFASGLGQADAGFLEQAVSAFSVAIEEVPDWAEAFYNRAIVLERLGRIRESLADYHRYLELTPSEIDPVVAAVSERIGMLEGSVVAPTPSPGATLALGVVPGMGQYYNGRGVTGTVVLGAVAGAVAAGVMVKKVTVRCLNTPPAGADCPPNEVVGETTERPYLKPAMGVAVGVTLVGAIEAYIRARGRRAAQAEAVENLAEGGFRVTGPTVAMRGGRVDVNVVGLRFR
jgi:tetratricopeptide (TPR) repeat protein